MSRHELLNIRNIGTAMLADLTSIGIYSVRQLARSQPDALFRRLERMSQKRHDPCVWDVFAAAIQQARTGQARDWWTFTPERKQRQCLGTFPPGPRANPARRA